MRVNLHILVLDKAKDVVQFICDIPFYLWASVTAVLNVMVDALSSSWRSKRQSLDNETILVTGAAAGIGREAVLKLAKNSKNVKFILWDINETGLLETSEQCRKLGVTSVYTYVVDLSKRKDISDTADKVRKEVGHVTILFNNAGLLQYNEFLEMSPAFEEKILQVNLHSYLWTIREFLPGMIKRGNGHLVNTCSALSYIRFHYLSAYVASKYGLRGFLECLKLEMRNHPGKPDIKFTTIYPGWVKTGMTSAINWEPRYKTWKHMQQLDSEYVAEKIVDGILKKKEEIYVPSAVQYMKYFYELIPRHLFDRVENFMFRNLKIVLGPSVNSTAAKVGNNNITSHNAPPSPTPIKQIVIQIPTDHATTNAVDPVDLDELKNVVEGN